MLWLRRIEPLARPLIRAHARLSRGLTLGVQGLVTDDDGRVLLIQQTYTPGWRLPGGGVERGETTEAALARELAEEVGVEAMERPRLVSIHSNERRYPGDHILLYRVGAWRPCQATSRGEIHARAWFAPDQLPEELTRGTRARLLEALGDRPSSLEW